MQISYIVYVDMIFMKKNLWSRCYMSWTGLGFQWLLFLLSAIFIFSLAIYFQLTLQYEMMYIYMNSILGLQVFL